MTQEDKELREIVLGELHKYNGDNIYEAPWALDSTGLQYPLYFAKLGANWQRREHQALQENTKIQWLGNNLKEVVEFTGKSPRFEEWFKSWDEYETYVREHNNIFKLFNGDGSHYEVPVGAWIVKTPDGYNVASKATFVPSTREKESTPSEPSEAAVFATMSALKAEFTNYEHFYQCRVKMPSDLGTTTEVWDRGKTLYEAALGVYKKL